MKMFNLNLDVFFINRFEKMFVIVLIEMNDGEIDNNRIYLLQVFFVDVYVYCGVLIIN